MNNNIDFKKHLTYILPIIILLIAGYFYYQHINKNKNSEIPQNNSAKQGGAIVMSDDNTNNNSQGYIIENNSDSNTTINNGQTYLQIINKIRKPINEGFDSLNEKLKYTTIFNDTDTQKAIYDLKNSINEAINEFNNLKIEEKFKTANEQGIESLKYLQKSMEAFEQMNNTSVQTEKQKYYDLYGYNLDQSNKILKAIVIPQ